MRANVAAAVLLLGALAWSVMPSVPASRAAAIVAAAPSSEPKPEPTSVATAEATATAEGADTTASVRPSRRPRCGEWGVFCAGAVTGDITPPITSPQWAYTARNCPEATAVDVAGHTADPQNHVEEGQAYLLHGGPHCVAGKVAPDTELYSKTWPGTEGTFGRLQANTYVLDDGRGQRVAIIQADLGGVPGELHSYVARNIKGLGIDQAHLLISATHDHGSVGGMWLGAGYAALGGDAYDPRVFTAVGTGMINAIKAATARLTPAKMAYGFGSVTNANHNRDTGSWSLDPESKLGTDPTNAPRLMVMRIDTLGGLPLGVISNFANHGIIHGTFNYYYSGDNQGSTTRMVARGIQAAAMAQGIKFPAGWKVVDSMVNGAVGDITPEADDGGWPKSDFSTYGDASGFDDPNSQQFARMENGGMRQAPEAIRVWTELGKKLSSNVTLDSRFDFICMCDQVVPDDPFDPYSHAPFIPANDDPAYGRVSTNAVLGAGGISDAPSQANDVLKLLPGLPAGSGPCDHFLNCFSQTVVPAHHLERPTLTASAGVSPYNTRVQVMRINDLALAAMPGEPTIEMGRRTERSILKAAPHIFKNAITVGLANDYASYFPTIQEYESYHYEGSFSLFGQQTGNVLKARLVHLAQLMQDRAPVEACTLSRACFMPPDSLAPTAAPTPLAPDVQAGTIEAQPSPIQRFGATNFQWVGGGPSAEWNQGQPMVQLQRQDGAAWTTVATDLDTEVPVHYVKNGGLHHWEAFLDTTRDWTAGTYRFHVTGHSATAPTTVTPYSLDSDAFTIAPYTGLVLTRTGAGNYEVDYPAPVGGVTYRYREKLARTATVNGTYPAAFHLNPGQVLVIPVGGIVDSWGNRNGAAITVTG